MLPNTAPRPKRPMTFLRVTGRRLRVRDIVYALAYGLAAAFTLHPSAATEFRGPNVLPDPLYEVRLEKSVQIQMRDGVFLSTDIYFPKGAEGELPTILVRTPYDKNEWRKPLGSGSRWVEAWIFAAQGYAVAVQDVRGKWESGGEFSINSTVQTDFPDTVDWLVRQRWSNGRVGTYGCSYLGENQIIQATVKHPAHVTMVPQAAGGGVGGAAGRYRQFGVKNGGAIELGMGLGWFMSHGSRINMQPNPPIDRETLLQIAPLLTFGPREPDYDFDAAAKSLPLLNLPTRFGGPPSDWNDYISWAPGDPRWEDRGYLDENDTANVPALHVNSWYDYGVADTIATRDFLAERSETSLARENQYLLVGAGAHCRNEFAEEDTPVGERDVGDARFPFWKLYLAWFDRWLREDERALDNVPKVHYFLLGKNEWRSGDVFPPEGTRTVEYHLSSGGRANSLHGDGDLIVGPVVEAQPADIFTYDPANPVPTFGGPLCCTAGDDMPAGSFDQRHIEARSDVLVYETPPLTEGVSVTGPVKLVLHVSSDAPDTDFTAKLIDVYPDGRAFNVQEGIQRVRYRESQHEAVFMRPGEIYEIEVDLQATANHFAEGHRIRLEISSSSFPRWDRNLNTGGNNFDETSWNVAQNGVHHGPAYPSRLILPVAPE